MPPTYVTGSAAASGAASFVSVPRPASIVAGNLLVAIMYQANPLTVRSVSGGGWTEKYASTYVTNAGAFVVWTKVATGSEPANYTVSGAEYLAAAILQYSSASDVEGWVTASASSGGFATSPAATATAADRRLMVAYGCFVGSTYSTPAALTARQSARSDTNESLYVFEGPVVNTGPSSTYASTHGASGSPWNALSLLVVPSGGATPVTGAGSLVAGSPTLSGAGAVQLSGAGVLVAGSPTLSGAGAVQLTGAGSLVAGSPTLSGAGAVQLTGAGSLVASAPSLSGAGAVQLTGAGALVAGSPTLSGAGAVIDVARYRDITAVFGAVRTRSLAGFVVAGSVSASARTRSLDVVLSEHPPEEP